MHPPLRTLLHAYRASHRATPDEHGVVERMLALLDVPNCFERICLRAHFTASAWILSPDRTRCLLTHHKKLERWLQLGGHADGESDLFQVALREATEESGMTGFTLLCDGIFDVDIHPIPARKDEPAHEHFDVRFLLQAPSLTYQVSEESHDLAWVGHEDLERLTVESSILRLHHKAIRATAVGGFLGPSGAAPDFDSL